MAARGLGLVAVALLLAACGGGGGGSGGGGSVGTASPQGGLTLPTAGNGSSVIAESGTLGGLQIVRQTTSGKSSVSVAGTPQTWRNTTTPIGDLAVFRSLDGASAVVTGGNGTSGAANITSFEYTNFGVWLESSASGVLTGPSNEVSGAGGFVIGDPTPVGDMPRAGSASYSGRAVAVELRDGQAPRPLSGTLDATVDFNAGRLSAAADLAGAADGSSFGRVSMDGLSISGNRFSGAASAGDRTGSVEGGFAGPGAAELGGSFALEGSSTVHGAFAGTSR